ncbi:unnamed protein product [Coregonus sp. 'balchen']|nr:unnamed protein product [Coregonus sp. 'balchen']
MKICSASGTLAMARLRNPTKHQKPPLEPNQKPFMTPAQKAPGATEQNTPKASVPNGTEVETKQKPKGGKPGTKFSTVDILRQRLREKIEESRGQGTPKDPSSEEGQN